MYKKRRFNESFVSSLTFQVDLVALLESYAVTVKKRGRHFMAKCPFHDERTPSMAVNPETGRYHCFGCGANGTAVSFLMDHIGLDYVAAIQELSARAGMALVYEDGEVIRNDNITKPTVVRQLPPPKILEPFSPVVPELAWQYIPKKHRELGEVVKIWWYTDSYMVYLFPPCINEEGNSKKEFRPVHWCPVNNEWKFGDPPGCLLPIYKAEWLRPGQKIIFCEGEKAADAATSYFPSGLCTTTAHGSKSPYRSDFSPVRGHEVFIFPDNDLPGWLYACDVAELCQKAGASMVKIVYWECREVPPKWDLADPLLEGWPKEKLVQSVKVFEWGGDL
jgi:hypothetical protein